MIFLLFAITIFSPFGFAENCPANISSVLKSEKILLEQTLITVPGLEFSKSIEKPLSCIISIFKSSNGMLRQVAHTSLTALYERTRNEAYDFDPRYKVIAKILIRESIKNENIRHIVLGGYAQGMKNAYEMFCGEDDRAHCIDMLPTNQLIKDQKDLISAGNVYLLKIVYDQVDSSQQKQIRERVKELYKDLKQDPGIRGLVIQEIYDQLFPEIPLSLFYS